MFYSLDQEAQLDNDGKDTYWQIGDINGYLKRGGRSFELVQFANLNPAIVKDHSHGQGGYQVRQNFKQMLAPVRRILNQEVHTEVRTIPDANPSPDKSY